MPPLELPPDIDPAQPWWLNLIYLLAWVLVTSGATLGGVWIVNRPLRRKLDAVDNQTANAHADAEYPNLREEITAMRTSQDAKLTELKKAQEETARDIGGLRAETRHLAEADREDRAAAVEAHKQIYAAAAIDRAAMKAQHQETLAAVAALAEKVAKD